MKQNEKTSATASAAQNATGPNKKQRTLYEPSFEHDNCGIGAVVNIDGTKTHTIVDNALCIVEKLEHRAGKDASGETGDRVGILVQIGHKFFKEEAKRKKSS